MTAAARLMITTVVNSGIAFLILFIMMPSPPVGSQRCSSFVLLKRGAEPILSELLAEYGKAESPFDFSLAMLGNRFCIILGH